MMWAGALSATTLLAALAVRQADPAGAEVDPFPPESFDFP